MTAFFSDQYALAAILIGELLARVFRRLALLAVGEGQLPTGVKLPAGGELIVGKLIGVFPVNGHNDAVEIGGVLITAVDRRFALVLDLLHVMDRNIAERHL